MSLTTALIALAVVVLLMVRRFLGEPLGARRLIVPPLILIVMGAYTLSKIDLAASVHHAVVDGAVLGTGAVVAVLGGLLRGLTVRVYVQDGHVWYRYTLLTVAVWIGLIALRIGQSFAGHALAADQDLMNAGLLLVLGLSFLGEAAIVGRRAIATGAPFAPRGSRRAARASAGRP
ncbi:DUF1453 domain-containing protein [Dactylosporangium sp. NPDC048998]|uniref:DUF1453 domain-containing protein n=1 Tax=Dactylosporangium sp. NPDC048998 TaxID=3363976 RepID=UPI00371B0047